MCECLHDVIKVDMAGIVGWRALPEAKRVDESKSCQSKIPVFKYVAIHTANLVLPG
jgi:hypothetical protein